MFSITSELENGYNFNDFSFENEIYTNTIFNGFTCPLENSFDEENQDDKEISTNI